MILSFTKGQALGNDFILFDTHHTFSKDQLKFLADRRLGVGADQLISFQKISDKNHEFIIQFFNSDGSVAGACGNGSRFAAGYYASISGKTSFFFAVVKADGSHSILKANMSKDKNCQLSMPPPISFIDQDIEGVTQLHQISLQNDPIDQKHKGYYIDIGNPHIVFFGDNIINIPIEDLGSSLQNHFQDGINAEWVEIIDNHTIKMRVFERGAGITPACGTGACASAIAAICHKGVDAPVTVQCDGGDLIVDYDPASKELDLTGPFEIVFSGEISL